MSLLQPKYLPTVREHTVQGVWKAPGTSDGCNALAAVPPMFGLLLLLMFSSHPPNQKDGAGVVCPPHGWEFKKHLKHQVDLHILTLLVPRLAFMNVGGFVEGRLRHIIPYLQPSKE